jgi:hypothetical protein
VYLLLDFEMRMEQSSYYTKFLTDAK